MTADEARSAAPPDAAGNPPAPDATSLPGPARDRRLRVGILHVGRSDSGVRRYGLILAAETARRPMLRVTAVDAGVLEDRAGGLARHGRELAECDVVHLQWNKQGWSGGPRAIERLMDFRRTWRGPLVVTLHDVLERRGLRGRWLDTEMLGLRVVGRTATRMVVHSEAEVGRLRGFVPLDRVRVIPHFVEERRLAFSPAEARAKLDVEGRRIVTLLGFIYGRKGHQPMVEAIRGLHEDVLVVFAGGPIAGRTAFVDLLRERARDLGAGPGRLCITGWLTEEELETWIAATHLAVAPFKRLSASGSLSTWIAAGKPILTSDLPGFREYNARVPGALRLLESLAPGPLASGINAQLDADLPDVDPLVVALREQLTVPRTVDEYVEIYREAIRDAG